MQGALEEVSQAADLLIMKALIDDQVEQLAGERGKHGRSSGEPEVGGRHASSR